MSSVRVEKRPTDHGVVEVLLFEEPLLGHGLQIELDLGLCEEVVIGLTTCGGELAVLGTRLLGGRAHGFELLNLKEGEEQKEVMEAKDDEEEESEADGEVQEKVTQSMHVTCR